MNISLAINSNLGAPDNIIDRFIEIAKDLCENNKVSKTGLAQLIGPS